MSAARNIFLVGPMGAGKSTLGRRLALTLGLRFVDSDHEIEAHAGADIGFIFEREGEAGFRQREHRALEAISQKSGQVVATGGGAVLLPENRSLLRARGFVVYLQASVDQQFARTERSNLRPLLARGDRRQILTDLLERRDPLYREVADAVVVTDNRNGRSLVREIEQALQRARYTETQE